jgi:hypothetical protein
MDRRFWNAIGATFATSVVLSFIIHGLVLAQFYDALQSVYRPPVFDPARFALLLLAQLIMAAAMAVIYRQGAEAKPVLGRGLRFGLLAACVSVIPGYLIGYAVTNIPAKLAFMQIVLETIRIVLMALVIAWIYRRR